MLLSEGHLIWIILWQIPLVCWCKRVYLNTIGQIESIKFDSREEK